MLKIKKKDWENYINALAKVSDKAVKEMQDFIDKNGMENVTAVIGKSYQCSVKYGEAAMALTCEMYDKIAVVQKAKVRPAVPARDVTMQEVKDTVNHALRTAPSTVPAVTGKLVKKASSRTMRKNAARDGAKMALVPSADGCPFCKMLGSRGWESARAGRSTNFEAHLHPHCKCEYVVDIKGGMQVEGYDPDALYDEFMSVDGSSWEERMNIMRSQQRQIPAIRDKINAQKRAAYEERVVRENIRRLEEEAKIWVKRLSEAETSSIKKYAYNPGDASPNRLFERINTALRSGDNDYDGLGYHIENISGGIRKFKIKHDFKVYRRVDVDPFTAMNVGDCFRGEQFFSTSVDPKRVLKKKYSIEIYVKKGTSGAYIDSLSEFDQTELLLDKDVIYKVKSKQGKKTILEVIV